MRLFTGLLVLAIPAGGVGSPFYKCETADGSTRYQDTPCAATEAESQPRIVDNALDSSADRARIRRTEAEERVEQLQDLLGAGESASAPSMQYYSYRCAANGETWYRHDRCPPSITVTEQAEVRVSGSDYVPNINAWVHIDDTAKMDQKREVPVESIQVRRSVACQSILNSGSRAGANRDSPYSTYERNKGTDPCAPRFTQ